MKLTEKITQALKPTWIELDRDGYKLSLRRNGMFFVVSELVQNAWDSDATKVDVTLSKPDKNGKSTLTCVDNSPKGYSNLAHAHTLFAESEKKSDPTKRGRFNAGEKQVLVMMDEAEIKSTTGTLTFLRNGKRKESSEGTKAGSSFHGTLSLTTEEYADICTKVQLLSPPIPTTFNGTALAAREVIKTIKTTLPTEVSDASGVLRPTKRVTEIVLYALRDGEVATLFEKGLPVVELNGGSWHVDVQQKVPLNTERNNVSSAYQRAIGVAVVNAMHAELSEKEAAEPWVEQALSDDRLKEDAIKSVADKKYGQNAVMTSTTDDGANREAASQNVPVVPRRSISAGAKKNFAKAGVMQAADKAQDGKFATDVGNLKLETVPEEKHDDAMKAYEKFIVAVSPILINHSVTVRFINDGSDLIQGCTQWKKDSFIFTVNLAYHDCEDWHQNFELLLHELAHHAVQSNDHLIKKFYDTVTELGAKLAKLAIDRPELFPDVDQWLDRLDEMGKEEEVAAA